MGKVELMQEKIAEQRQLPNELKEKLNNITFINLLISIALMIYMIVVNLLFINESAEVFLNSTRTSAISFAILDIIILEIAYRRDSITLAVHAIELICVSLFVLAIPYLYFYVDTTIRSIIMMAPVFFSIYYVGNSIVIHIIGANKYRNHLSDVPEILKEDNENTSYIDDVELDSEKNVDIDEQELISGVQEIEQRKNEEKEFIKSAKKEAIKKEKDND